MPLPNLSAENWTVHGALPHIDPASPDVDFEDFDEDLIQYCDRRSGSCLDVSWMPAYSPNGEFVCRLVEDNEWRFPVETFETRSLAEVETWLSEKCIDIEESYGHEDEIVDHPHIAKVDPEPKLIQAPITRESKPGFSTSAPESFRIHLAEAA